VRLTLLDLSSNPIGDSGGAALATALRSNRHLSEMRLRATGLGESVVAVFETLYVNRALVSLDLGENYIAEEASSTLEEALGQNNTLRTLNLKSCAMQGETFVALANALKINCCLEALELDNNFVRDDGACALANALRLNDSLKSIHFRNCQIDAKGASALTSAARANAVIEKMTGLFENGVDKLALKYACNLLLQANSCLVFGSHISNLLAQGLPKQLAELKLNLAFSFDVKNNDLERLASGVKEIRTLRGFDLGLEGCLNVGDAGVSAFVGCLPPKLDTFACDISLCSKVGDTGLLALVTALPPALKKFSMRAVGSSVAADKWSLDLNHAYKWRKDERMKAVSSRPAALVEALERDTALMRAEDKVLDVESKGQAQALVDANVLRSPWMPVGNPSSLYPADQATTGDCYRVSSGQLLASSASSQGLNGSFIGYDFPAGYNSAPAKTSETFFVKGKIEGLRSESAKNLHSRNVLHGSSSWRPASSTPSSTRTQFHAGASARPVPRTSNAAPRRPASAGRYRSTVGRPSFGRGVSSSSSGSGSAFRGAAGKSPPHLVPQTPTTPAPASRRPIHGAVRHAPVRGHR